jgi:hypothetical protein
MPHGVRSTDRPMTPPTWPTPPASRNPSRSAAKPRAASPVTVVRFTLPAGTASAGEQVFVKMECYPCHTVAGKRFGDPAQNPGGIGPDLTAATRVCHESTSPARSRRRTASRASGWATPCCRQRWPTISTRTTTPTPGPAQPGRRAGHTRTRGNDPRADRDAPTLDRAAGEGAARPRRSPIPVRPTSS